MDAPGKFEMQRLKSVVEKGRLYASERQFVCAALRGRIRDAEVVEVEGLGKMFNVVPPQHSSGRGRIEFDPQLVSGLAADHSYPEWVVSAHLELLIRARYDEWHKGVGTFTYTDSKEAHLTTNA